MSDEHTPLENEIRRLIGAAGPMPRHPSQLYEAALEGIALFIVLGLLMRFGALKRPGVVTGAFLLGSKLIGH